MAAISYMLPVVVMGGLMMATAKITGQFINIEHSPFSVLDKVGFMTIKFMYPVFAMYLAFSIAGKPALIPGLIGGIMSDEVYKRFFDIEGFMPSGFFGAIGIGFLWAIWCAGSMIRFTSASSSPPLKPCCSSR